MPKINDSDIQSALFLARQGSYTGAVNTITGKSILGVDPKAFLIFLAMYFMDNPLQTDIILASWMLLAGFTDEKTISKRQEMFILASGYSSPKKPLEGEIERNAIGSDKLGRRVQNLQKYEERLYEKLAKNILEAVATKDEIGSYFHDRAKIRSIEEAAKDNYYDNNIRRVIFPNPSFRNPMPSASGQVDPSYPHFIGRKEILDSLKNNFFIKKNRVQILCGMAGVGKSTIANEYIHRNLANYNFIWWLDASSKSTLTASCANLLSEEDSGFNGSENPNDILIRFKKFFKGRTHWLLVFDNADYFAKNNEDETKLLKNLFAHIPSTGGHTIITTRNARELEKAVIHHIEPFDLITSIAYLVDITEQPEDDYTRILAERLNNLPLALTYAGNYIKKHTSYEGYLNLWERESLKLWDQEDGHYADRTVRQAFDISLNKIRETVSPKRKHNVIELLEFCADFEAEYLPINAYLRYAESFPDLESYDFHELERQAVYEGLYGRTLKNPADGRYYHTHYIIIDENSYEERWVDGPNAGEIVPPEQKHYSTSHLISALSDTLERNELIRILSEYSLIECRDDRLYMHPLLREIIRDERYDKTDPNAPKANIPFYLVYQVLRIYGDEKRAADSHLAFLMSQLKQMEEDIQNLPMDITRHGFLDAEVFLVYDQIFLNLLEYGDRKLIQEYRERRWLIEKCIIEQDEECPCALQLWLIQDKFYNELAMRLGRRIIFQTHKSPAKVKETSELYRWHFTRWPKEVKAVDSDNPALVVISVVLDNPDTATEEVYSLISDIKKSRMAIALPIEYNDDTVFSKFATKTAKRLTITKSDETIEK